MHAMTATPADGGMGSGPGKVAAYWRLLATKRSVSDLSPAGAGGIGGSSPLGGTVMIAVLSSRAGITASLNRDIWDRNRCQGARWVRGGATSGYSRDRNPPAARRAITACHGQGTGRWRGRLNTQAWGTLGTSAAQPGYTAVTGIAARPPGGSAASRAS